MQINLDSVQGCLQQPMNFIAFYARRRGVMQRPFHIG